MQGKTVNGEVMSRVIRCDIYAGGERIRSFPEDRSLSVLKAYTRNGNALVLECLDARGRVVEVETTLPYLLIVESPAGCVGQARTAREVTVPGLPFGECASA